MGTVSIFSHRSYRAYLRALVKAQDEPWGLIAKMAKAAQCQRPYLSKVLKGEAQLTPAQAFGLSRFWKLNPAETDYLMNLLEQERAGSLEYRQYIERKANVLKKDHEDLAKRVQRESSEPNDQQVNYYSAWQWTAIHILVSIPEFQTLEAVCKRLSLPPVLAETILIKLESYGFVRKSGGRWMYRSHESHISKLSPLVAFHHSNWRQRAVQDAQNPEYDSVHFTVVQSLSKSDYEVLKQMTIDFIEECSQVAGPSKSEELMCLTVDFFKP